MTQSQKPSTANSRTALTRSTVLARIPSSVMTHGSINLCQEMEANTSQQEQEQDEEEFVLLDLEGACGKVDIPPNAPYVLSGLDTLNPVLLIGDKLKLIGEYEETIGTCFVFSEEETTPIVNEETGQSEENPSTSKGVGDSNQAPTKKIKPIARLQKTLKFRLVSEVDSVGTTADAQTADEPSSSKQ